MSSGFPRNLAHTVASSQTNWTQLWHDGNAARAPEPLLALVHDQHRANFELWHEEDKARAPDASDAQIATGKRAIDKLNQRRNDLIEQIDDAILAEIQRHIALAAPKQSEGGWNSETPGSIIDKLSILSLKVYHMREQTQRLDAAPQHLQKCRARLEVLERQHADLATALHTLLDDLCAGRKQMKLYRQFKMYNDPDSNPAIYGAKKK